MSSSSKFINAFKIIPKELFRLNNGPSIALREYSPQRNRSYDLLTEAGKVKPKALQPSSYAAPNGASMRPNTAKQNKLVSTFKGANMLVYCVPAGTPLPDDLLLVHENHDHYSLQPAKEMTVTELNKTITEFLQANGTTLSQEQWLETYPTPTETS
ncbi:MAG: hypothetical protein M1817_004909 [Caeruleum heppii]|nr:MAG: hypothetical protein M1817_004909 [Caeruleum heppii]